MAEESKSNYTPDEEKIPVSEPEKDIPEPTPREKILDGINKIGDYLHIPLLKILNGTSFFIVIYLTAWVLNALYPSTIKFDLPELRAFYIMLVGKQTAEHAVNSIFNSPRGLPPKENKQMND